MSNTILHKAATRGHADHGWLESFQSFSFADYYNPERIQFGALRVLNDDRVEGGKGFGSHPHDNMEIISIPLEGSLVHKDNLGNTRIVSKGEIQVMSTGKGVFHSEYNNSPDQPAKFLQIWVFPNRLNVTPRYDQILRDPVKEHNRLQQLIAPAPPEGDSVGLPAKGLPAKGLSAKGLPDKGLPAPQAEETWIYQDAWFQIGHFDKGKGVSYEPMKKGNGVYLFVISGSFRVGEGQLLDTRDGLGITGEDRIDLTATTGDSEILVMEVPFKIR